MSEPLAEQRTIVEHPFHSTRAGIAAQHETSQRQHPSFGNVQSCTGSSSSQGDDSLYGMPRTISGPISFVSQTGSFCQTAMTASNLPLSGRTSPMAKCFLKDRRPFRAQMKPIVAPTRQVTVPASRRGGLAVQSGRNERRLCKCRGHGLIREFRFLSWVGIRNVVLVMMLENWNHSRGATELRRPVAPRPVLPVSDCSRVQLVAQLSTCLVQQRS